MDERRKFRRVECNARGRAENLEQGIEFGIVTRDITPEGVRLVTDYGPKIGDVLDLKITINGSTVQCTAKVVWIDHDPSHNNRERFQCGLSITHIPYRDWSEMIHFYSKQVGQQYFSNNFLPS